MPRHIEEHLGERLTLADVAVQLGTSSDNVTRLLKRADREAFHAASDRTAPPESAELLAGTDLRIADIGEAVGFEDNAYFARRFKQ